jgi:regulatory protein
VNERALEFAYRYLNRRERTSGELHEHLLGRGVDERVADAAVQELTRQGYLDDARFARVFTQDKRELEHWGSERIRRALLRRGIDSELIETALADRDEPDPREGELERALGILHRRFSAPPADRRERDRALGVLLRKGYGTELALDALAAHRRDLP